MTFTSRLRNFIDVNNQSTQKHYDWLKNILLMASGLIGILVSLHTKKSETQIQHLLFSITIGSIGAGILCGSISMYGEISVLNKLKNKLQEKILEELKSGISDESISKQITAADRSKIYDIFETVSYLSFITGIITLVIYSIYLDL